MSSPLRPLQAQIRHRQRLAGVYVPSYKDDRAGRYAFIRVYERGIANILAFL